MTTAYVSNPHLHADDAKDDSLALVDYSAALSHETETTRLSAKGGVSATRYIDNSEYDNDIFDMTLSAAHETETGASQFDYSFIRDTTLTSEFETTGFVQTRKDRSKNLIHASHTQQISESFAAGATYSRSEVDYENGLGTPLIDYRYQVFSLNLLGNYSERIGWGLTGSFSDYQAPDADYQSETRLLSASFDAELDDKTKLSGSLGYSLTDIDSPSASADDDQQGALSYAFSLSREFEDFSMGINARRQEQPTGSGYVQTSEKLSADFHKDISPRWAADLKFSALRNNLNDAATSDEHRKLLVLDASCGYRITRDLSINAFYQARKQQYTDNDTSAHSHAVGLTLRYNWPEKSFLH
jgi:hypothetical protein